jgi:hypothetical protein
MRANERSGSAVIQARGGEPHVVEPRLSKREVIFLLDQLDGRMIESPHAFVGGNGGGEQGAANYNVRQDAHGVASISLNHTH